MGNSNFVDYVKVHVSSGKGGQGSAHLRREKFVAKGGPGKPAGTRIIFLWKQGLEDQGGPSDIMARIL